MIKKFIFFDNNIKKFIDPATHGLRFYLFKLPSDMSNSRNSLVPTIYTSATTSLLVSSTNNFKGKEEKKEKWLSPLISISGGLGIRSWQVYTILFSSLFWIRSWQVYTILLSSLCEISFISHIYYILPLVLTFFFLFMKFHYFSIIKYINTNVYDCACLTYLLYLTVSPLLLFFFFWNYVVLV